MSSILKLLTIVMASTSTLTKAEAADDVLSFFVNGKYPDSNYSLKCGNDDYSELDDITNGSSVFCPGTSAGRNFAIFKEERPDGLLRESNPVLIEEDDYCSIGNRYGDKGEYLEVSCGSGT